MIIEGLNKSPKEEFFDIGVFKLKDKENRNGVVIDLNLLPKPITEVSKLFFMKIRGENNKVRILVQWKLEQTQVTNNQQNNDTAK